MDVAVSKKDSTNSIVVQVPSKPIRYCIMGKPIPLDRPRFSQGHVWDSQKKLKHSWGVQLQQQHQDRPLFSDVPLHLEVEFFLPFPRVTVKKQMLMVNKLHIARPDLSNLIKFVEDASTGILFLDDCIIASISSSKRYAEEPRTEFTFIEIK
jgi:Holliday junction resolvase RusA-like endonuclease